MDAVRADALAARSHLAARGWIPRKAESFRHLPPPPATAWLGEPIDPWWPAPALPQGGWTLREIGDHPLGAVDAQWLDAADSDQRAQLLAGLPPPGDDEAAPFAWAHRALVRDGLRVRVTEGTAWLQLRRRPGAQVEAPLLVIELAPGAHCVLLESHEAAADGSASVQNLQVHALLGEGASLQHARVVLPGAQDQWAHEVQARVPANASYQQALLAAPRRHPGASDGHPRASDGHPRASDGHPRASDRHPREGGDPGAGGYHLQRSVLVLEGEGAQATQSSVLLAAGAALDQQTRLRHAAPRTASAIDMLALGAGAAHLVANAHTTIAAGCDDAQARQRLAGVPTAGQPRLVLRPHLEIHHDQVQAQHGATWGALPEEALFFARQRGLDEATAKGLILHGLAGATLARALPQELLEAIGLEQLLAEAVGHHLHQEPIHG